MLAHHFSNDHWRAEHVAQLSELIVPTLETEHRASVVIGGGFMPYLLPLVQPEALVFVDHDVRVTGFARRRLEMLASSRSWEQYLDFVMEDQNLYNFSIPEFRAETNRAKRTGLMSEETHASSKQLLDHMRTSAVIGDVTHTTTAEEVLENLDGAVPTFINFTNAASWLRPFGPLSRKVPWQRTRAFAKAIGAMDDTVVVDSDKGLLRPHIDRFATYRKAA